jgi:hypothetical protein
MRPTALFLSVESSWAAASGTSVGPSEAVTVPLVAKDVGTVDDTTFMVPDSESLSEDPVDERGEVGVGEAVLKVVASDLNVEEGVAVALGNWLWVFGVGLGVGVTKVDSKIVRTGNTVDVLKDRVVWCPGS